MQLEVTGLSREEVNRFHRDGFIIAPYRLSATDVDILSDGISRMVALHPEKRNEPISSGHFRHIDAEGREFSLMQFCRDERLLDMVESLHGPDLALWTTTVFERPAYEGVATPWHQDGQYWPIYPMAGVSAWVAATRVTKENGCVRVIPGSHRHQAHSLATEDRIFPRQTDPAELNNADAVDIELEPGQMMLFDSGLIHGSWPNHSSQIRRGFVMRYLPTTSFFDHDGKAEYSTDGKPLYADRALFLVRGGDKCGRNDFARNH